MKSNRITLKIKLLGELFISAAMAFLATMLLFIGFFGIVHIFSRRAYAAILAWFNRTPMAAPVLMLFAMAFFSVLLAVIYMKRLEPTTDYLQEIRNHIEHFSIGGENLDIPVRTRDEIGLLVETVNQMSSRNNALIKEERRWEQSKTELITNMSHDLRTPLTSISGFLGIIKDKDYTGEQELAHYADIAYRKCNELKELTDNLVAYSKLANDEVVFNKCRIKLDELILQVVSELTPLFSQACMPVDCRDMIRDTYIEADPKELARVFENLLGNAVKYGCSDKGIKISTEIVNTYAVVSIRNFGSPIPGDELPHIFERFYRADKSRERNGNGLGLAIAKKILDKHAGKIEAESNGEFTEFRIFLAL